MKVNIEEIKATIATHYLKGAFNEMNINSFKTIFHPEFAIITIQDDGSLYLFTRNMWEEVLKKRMQDREFDIASVALKPHYRTIDVEGQSASVSMDLIRSGQVVFTDFLLLKFVKDSWIIVGKIFHEHT